MLNGKRVVKNTIWIVAGHLYTALFNFIMNIFTANYLGPSNAGIIGYITSFINFFVSIGCLGFTNIAVKEIIKNKNDQGAVVGTAFILQSISLIISYGFTILSIYLFNIDDKVMLICALLQSLIIIFRVFDNFTYYFQAKLESKYITIITICSYTIMQLYKVFLLLTEKSVEWFAAAQAIDVLVVAIAISCVYIGKKGPKFVFSKNIAKILLRQGIPYMIMGTIGILYSSIDRIMLKEMLHGTYEVGIYEQAFGLSHFWSFVATAIIVSFSTMIYESCCLYGINSKEYKLRMRQLYCIVFWICIIIAISLNILLPIIITFLYDEMYKSSIIPSIILTWAAVFAFMGSAKSVQLLSEEKQKYGIFFAILAVILNIIINALLIPSMKSIGAAIATLVAEAFICFVSPFILKPTRNIGKTMIQGVCFKNVQFNEIIDIIKQKVSKHRVSNKDENINNTDNCNNNKYDVSNIIVDKNIDNIVINDNHENIKQKEEK